MPFTLKYDPYNDPMRKAVEDIPPVEVPPVNEHNINYFLKALNFLAPQLYRTTSRLMGGDYKQAGFDPMSAARADLVPDDPNSALTGLFPGGPAIAGIEMRSGKMAGEQMFKKFPKEHQDIIEAVLSKEPAYIPYQTHKAGLAPLVFVNPPSHGGAAPVLNTLENIDDYAKLHKNALGFASKFYGEPFTSVSYRAPFDTVVHENIHDKVSRLLDSLGNTDIINKIERQLIKGTGVQAPIPALKRALEWAEYEFPHFKKNYDIPILPSRRTGEELLAHGPRLLKGENKSLFMNWDKPPYEITDEAEKAIKYLTESYNSPILKALMEMGESTTPKYTKTDIYSPTQGGLWGWPKFPSSHRTIKSYGGKILREEKDIPKHWQEYGLR